MFKILAKINRLFLPSFTKNGLDISKAKKWQMAIIGYRYYVTTRALDL
ncbi:SsrA-binding protein [Flavobacterium sp.]